MDEDPIPAAMPLLIYGFLFGFFVVVNGLYYLIQWLLK